MTKYHEFDDIYDRFRERYPSLNKHVTKGEPTLPKILERGEELGIDPSKLERAREIGMLTGQIHMPYQGAERIYNKIKGMLGKQEEKDGKDHSSVLDFLDPIKDNDLIATYIFAISPEVRNYVRDNIDSLYKVTLTIGSKKRKGCALPVRTGNSGNGGFLSPKLKKLISNLPQPITDEEKIIREKIDLLVDVKVERETFPRFADNFEMGMELLRDNISSEKNENLRKAYERALTRYDSYNKFEVKNVNTEFVHPTTGEKGTLPSLHQRVAMYHLTKNRRFGVFDGCGTGKTAIATCSVPLIEDILEEEGKKLNRVIIVGPERSKKAWKKGLIGELHERYLTQSQDVFVINGQKKDEIFLDELRTKKWIVVNYEQLITRMPNSDKLFIDVLTELGAPVVFFDEAHVVKSHKNKTKTGRDTLSAASRKLAQQAQFLGLLTASPIKDKLIDYGVLYHLLRPDLCPTPETLKQLMEDNPRALYTLVKENSIRRTSDEINRDLDWEELEELVDIELNSRFEDQRRLYNHIVQTRPRNWLTEARKTLIDPRLVDPNILKKLNLLGKFGPNSSAKYQRLEELLVADEGPISKGEKFIVFSSMFKQGVTQSGNPNLKKKYAENKDSPNYDNLQLNKSLKEIVEESLEKQFGRKFNIGIIDGNIPVDERENIVDRLKLDLDGIICTTETGGESLDFTSANWAFFLDEDYSPETKTQAIFRLIRPGQDKKVQIRYLRGAKTLDENLRDYVDRKRLINAMAVDGHEITKEEMDLLNDTEGRKFGEMVKRSLGGISIDTTQAEIDNVNDFEVKQRVTREPRSSSRKSSGSYETTDAQRIMAWIGKDKFGCWFDPEFVELYMQALANLSVPVVHRAKICDLINRANRGELVFPSRVISEGSGPSLLYSAYQSLTPLVEANGLVIPTITDRDMSQLMLDKGANPNQILGCMTGKDSVIKSETVDMVDNESISLLSDENEVRSSLIEANRILRPNGLIELIVKNMRFMDGGVYDETGPYRGQRRDFYSGMGNLGFEVLTEKNTGFRMSKDMFERLRDEHGEHFAESFASKLNETYMMIARKVDRPNNRTNAKDFWFVRTGQTKEEHENKSEPVILSDGPEIFGFDPSESRSIIIPRSRRKGQRIRRGHFNV